MKAKLILSFIAFFTASIAFSQDYHVNLPSKVTLKDKLDPLAQNERFPSINMDAHKSIKMKTFTIDKKDTKKNKRKTFMYGNTRLGSSSQLYNRYSKNIYGAGVGSTNTNIINIHKTPPSIFDPISSGKVKLVNIK